MSPASTKARQTAAVIGLVRSGGPFCIVVAVFTICICVLWRFFGADVCQVSLRGMEIARDTSVAQAEAAKYALETVKLATKTIEQADYRRASQLSEMK